MNNIKVKSVDELFQELKEKGLDGSLAMDYGVTVASFEVDDDMESKNQFVENVIKAVEIYQQYSNALNSVVTDFLREVNHYSLK